MASFAHNVLEMVRKLGGGIGPLGPESPTDAIAASAEFTTDDAMMNSGAPPRCFAWPRTKMDLRGCVTNGFRRVGAV